MKSHIIESDNNLFIVQQNKRQVTKNLLSDKKPMDEPTRIPAEFLVESTRHINRSNKSKKNHPVQTWLVFSKNIDFYY